MPILKNSKNSISDNQTQDEKSTSRIQTNNENEQNPESKSSKLAKVAKYGCF